MEKIINITDEKDFLIASLKIDWENKKIEVINDKNYKVVEALAEKEKTDLYRLFFKGKDIGIIEVSFNKREIIPDVVSDLKIQKT